MGSLKQKNKKLNLNPCESCNNNYNFTHLQFNFSFLTSNKKYSLDSLDKDLKAILIDRIKELSEPDYLTMMNRGKSIGYETIDESFLNIKAQYSVEFESDPFRKRKRTTKFSIFRLDSNNSKTDCRMIGYLIDKVFYVLYFFHNHEHVK